jgi:hypothetical protein
MYWKPQAKIQFQFVTILKILKIKQGENCSENRLRSDEKAEELIRKLELESERRESERAQEKK